MISTLRQTTYWLAFATTLLQRSIAFSSKVTVQSAYKLPRIYLPDALAIGEIITLDYEDSHYLSTIMRLKKGYKFRAFNTVSGEFLCSVAYTPNRSRSSKDGTTIEVIELLRETEKEVFPFVLLFAPLRKTKLKLMFQKYVSFYVHLFVMLFR